MSTAYKLGFWIGDTVKLKKSSGKWTTEDRFQVLKCNPKNLKVKDLKTGGTVQGPYSLFVQADATDPLPFVPAAPVMSSFDTFAPFKLGVVVKLKDYSKRPPKWNYDDGQWFIVMKHNFDKVNIVKLGGENGKYWRMSPNSLEVVELPD